MKLILNLAKYSILKIKSFFRKVFNSFNYLFIFKKFIEFPNFSLIKLFLFSLYIYQINLKIKGRYCGTFVNKLTQAFAYDYIIGKFPNDNLYHTDIGILFGGAVLLKFKLFKFLKVHQRIIAIDPFSGYYKNSIDPLTKMGVNKTNFLNNVKKFEFDLNSLLIFKTLSQNKKTTNLLKKLTIVSLFIDGDHSFKGISSDWRSYSPLIIRGGILIIDDYKGPTYKGVTKFVDRLKNTKEWEILLQIDTTIIFIKLI